MEKGNAVRGILQFRAPKFFRMKLIARTCKPARLRFVMKECNLHLLQFRGAKR